MSCQVIDIRYRRSPLVQGGLEIPIQVTVDIDIGESSVLVLKKYEELVIKHYKEPVNGTFNVTDSVLEALMCDKDDDTELGAEEDSS